MRHCCRQWRTYSFLCSYPSLFFFFFQCIIQLLFNWKQLATWLHIVLHSELEKGNQGKGVGAHGGCGDSGSGAEEGRRAGQSVCTGKILGRCAHTQRPSLARLGGRRNIKERPRSYGHFSPSCHEAAAEGWPGGLRLCLQGSLALSQGSFDGGHQFPEFAFCIHIAITSLLGVNQLPAYCHFKEPGDLGSPLATDVQASGELIF